MSVFVTPILFVGVIVAVGVTEEDKIYNYMTYGRILDSSICLFLMITD